MKIELMIAALVFYINNIQKKMLVFLFINFANSIQFGYEAEKG